MEQPDPHLTLQGTYFATSSSMVKYTSTITQPTLGKFSRRDNGSSPSVPENYSGQHIETLIAFPLAASTIRQSWTFLCPNSGWKYKQRLKSLGSSRWEEIGLHLRLITLLKLVWGLLLMFRLAEPNQTCSTGVVPPPSPSQTTTTGESEPKLRRRTGKPSVWQTSHHPFPRPFSRLTAITQLTQHHNGTNELHSIRSTTISPST